MNAVECCDRVLVIDNRSWDGTRQIVEADDAFTYGKGKTRMTGRNIFIDVGSHEGETIQEVSKSPWKFDLIFGFEPQASLASRLQNQYCVNPGIVIVAAGLADRTGKTVLYGTGDGTSLFETKVNVDPAEIQTVETISASEFFSKNVKTDDCVIVKLNCEGAEGKILRDLAGNRQLEKISNVVIDFDLRKVRGSRREPRELIRMMEALGFHRYHLAEDVMIGNSHSERIRNWLAHTPQLDMYCTCPDQLQNNLKRPSIMRRIRRLIRYQLW